MSKRQRRRMTERRSVHMQHSRRRTVLPLAVAAVAAPAVAAPAAQASPHVVRLNGSVLNGLAFHRIDAMARAEHGLRRDNTSAAKAIANATQTGLLRPRPARPQRPVAPAKPVALSPTVMAPAPTPVEIQVAPTPAATPVQPSGTTAPASGTTAPATAASHARARRDSGSGRHGFTRRDFGSGLHGGTLRPRHRRSRAHLPTRLPAARSRRPPRRRPPPRLPEPPTPRRRPATPAATAAPATP